MSLDDPVQLLPELLDRLVDLGEMARQIIKASGGNGHRPDETTELIKYLSENLDSTSFSSDGTDASCPSQSIPQNSKGAGHE